MKLTQEEREKYRKEFVKNLHLMKMNLFVSDTTDFWLSKIDTILEERTKKCDCNEMPCHYDCQKNHTHKTYSCDMKTKEEILKNMMICMQRDMSVNKDSNTAQMVILEVLLDIRDILAKSK